MASVVQIVGFRGHVLLAQQIRFQPLHPGQHHVEMVLGGGPVRQRLQQGDFLLQPAPSLLDVRPQPVDFAVHFHRSLAQPLDFRIDPVEKFAELLGQQPFQRQGDEPFPDRVGLGAQPFELPAQTADPLDAVPHAPLVLDAVPSAPDLRQLFFFPQYIRHAGGCVVVGLGGEALHVAGLRGRQEMSPGRWTHRGTAARAGFSRGRSSHPGCRDSTHARRTRTNLHRADGETTVGPWFPPAVRARPE